MIYKQNSGFKTIGDVQHSAKSEQYIVVGVGRGGTTAVAASLHVLGVTVGELGKTFSEDNYENFEMSRAFRSRDWRGLQKLITTYEEQYSKFAWKLPDSNEQLPRIHRYFSNPYYIFVYRDLFAIANRKNITLDVDLI